MSDRPLLTAHDVARRLNVTGETVRRWAATGTLPAVTLPSGRYRFHPEDLERLTASNAGAA